MKRANVFQHFSKFKYNDRYLHIVGNPNFLKVFRITTRKKTVIGNGFNEGKKCLEKKQNTCTCFELFSRQKQPRKDIWHLFTSPF